MMWFNNKKIPTSKISKFSVLPYTQNEKLGNLGKFSFTSDFGSIWNSKFKNRENDLEEKALTLRCGLRRKYAHFGSSQVFDFALYLKLKIWKPWKVFVYFTFLSFWLHKVWERLKPFIDFQINRPHVLMSHVKYIRTPYIKRLLFMHVCFSLT